MRSDFLNTKGARGTEGGGRGGGGGGRGGGGGGSGGGRRLAGCGSVVESRAWHSPGVGGAGTGAFMSLLCV